MRRSTSPTRPGPTATPDAPAKRAFVYCRVSTDEQSQDDRYSLALQEERCRDYAKHKGWQVATVRKDVGSGKDAERPGYQELLADVRAGAIDVVITYRLDRLSRNVRDVYDFLHRSAEANVGFVSTSESFDTTTAMGRAMLGVAAVFAQLTREMIAENVRDGVAKRARSGKYVGGTATPPYGYTYSREQGKLLVVPEEALVVCRVFGLFARGKWGATRIARYLNQEGVPSKRRTQWSNRTVASLLRSPLYVGHLAYRGQEYDGEHEPVIDRGLFEEAQELIRQRAPLPPRTQQSRHLLSGIARCGQCGGRMIAHYGSYRNGTTRKSYRAYRHVANPYAGDRACPGMTKSADKLEAAVLEKVREVAASPQFQEAAFAEAKGQLASDLPGIRREREAVVSRLAEMTPRFERWAERLDAGQIDEEQFCSRNAALLKEKAELQARLAELDARAAEHEGVEVGMEEVRGMLRDFDTVWEHMAVEERREVLRSLIEDLRVWKDRAELKLLFLPPIELPIAFARGRSPGAAAQPTQQQLQGTRG